MIHKSNFVLLYLTFFCVAFLSSAAIAQNLETKIETYFKAISIFPQEKLYLHLDKPYYAAGERIYWKGYLVDAISHKLDAKSNFIYVELIGRDNRIVDKYKIKRDKDGFHGSLLLAPDIPVGEYCLRAYTQWMINVGDDYFYSHRFRVGNALDKNVQAFVRYEPSDREGYYTVIMHFLDQMKRPLSNVQVQSLLTEKEKTERFSRRSNAEGEIRFDIPVEKAAAGERHLRVSFQNAVYNFEKSFFVPLLGGKKMQFELSFFPEGGDLLSDCHQRVAFKAQQADGSNCDINGYLLNDLGDTISTFQTEHDGMGVVSFTPVTGRRYKAVASMDGEVYREFALPDVSTSGCQLSVRYLQGDIRYEVQTASHVPVKDTLYLVGHTRGSLTILVPLLPGRTTGRFSQAGLREGITELLLTDKTGRVLSRRLTFVVPVHSEKIDITGLPDAWGQRKRVDCVLNVSDRHGNPFQGSLSASLTDRNFVTPDSLSDHIFSSLSLTSDLKGEINNPGYYFQQRNRTVEYHTELLMLTHGWTRFRHDNLAGLPVVKLDYFIEGGQTISGKATTLLGKKAKKCPVVLLAPQMGLSAVCNTDDKGNFLFDGIEYRDTVTFVVQAKSKSRRANVYLELDSLPDLKPDYLFPARPEPEEKFEEYDNMVRDAYLNEGGMQVVRLNEITVTASKSVSETYTGTYSNFADYKTTGEGLRKFGTAWDALIHLPKIKVSESNTCLTLVGEDDTPLFLINEVRYEAESALDVLRGLSCSDIKSIEIYKSNIATGFFGHWASGGAISIILGNGVNVPVKASPSLVLFTSLGYSNAVEFYHPVYETKEQINSRKTDVRSTIYWNPSVQTDKDGKAVIRFYTPDNLIAPHLILEGITSEGEIVRFERNL